MSEKVEAQGGKQGKEWDDGADHEGITKIVIGKTRKGIRYIKFDYVKNGMVIAGSMHGEDDASASSYTFEVDHPDEFLVSVEGYYDDYGIIQGLQFKTNDKTSQLVGYGEDTKFSLGDENKMIIGFHGNAGKNLTSLGAYLVKSPVFEKVEARGGKFGQKWSDGGDHDSVIKIYVGGGKEGVQYIKFDYVKKAQPISGPIHGVKKNSFTQTFEINHPNEYIESVEGYYNGSGVIQALQFKTNKRESEVIGFEEGTKFTLGAKNKMVVGFHGYADKNVNSIGAYVVPITHKIVGPAGGSAGGKPWDHRGYKGLKRVYFGQETSLGKSWVSYVKFVYQNNDDKEETFEYGELHDPPQEFVLDYPNEHITRVEGCFGGGFNFLDKGLYSIFFVSSKGRTSAMVGTSGGTEFVLEDNGHALVGFFGRYGSAIDAIGAYFALP